MTTEFVQIGNWAFNPALISTVYFDHEERRAVIFLSQPRGDIKGEPVMRFENERYAAFMRWWHHDVIGPIVRRAATP